MKKLLLSVFLLVQLSFANEIYYIKNNQKVVLEVISSLSRSSLNIDFYRTDIGSVVGVGDKLLLKLKDSKNLEKYLLEFDLVQIATMNNHLFLLRTKDKAVTLNIANSLSQKEDVLYAHPDFLKRQLKR